MLAVLRLYLPALDHPQSMRTLARMAAEDELVLVCGHDWAAQLIGSLRRALPRHRVVAILVGDTLQDHERELLRDLLNDGYIPVILTLHDPDAVQLTGWLDPDVDVALPTYAQVA